MVHCYKEIYFVFYVQTLCPQLPPLHWPLAHSPGTWEMEGCNFEDPGLNYKEQNHSPLYLHLQDLNGAEEAIKTQA